ncbi:N-acetyltransferase [Mediterraneibacter sp. NSJ-55]|uniref:N-acetyltransferase n=1 Tax=Mediterraneibacter hominis TaxID=2763054 RepID=A0A923LH38_9FIRM|nr:N-acetyltransferase [Mediterraneibacter hominis]MBC5688657.1 N-acetyltransferase [Mediterraneibacter hominis]
MVRKYWQKDTESILQIWLDGNIEAHPFISQDYWRANYEKTREGLKEAEIFVYEIDGEICGFAGMIGEYLAGIFVRHDFRRKGIGMKLLSHIKKSYPAITLHVYKKNEAAARFYLREMFELVSEQTDRNTGETEYKMSWKRCQCNNKDI